ncbi:UNVERIFIED_CONTAM: hypothetical protein K2H54_006964 [Gekko kuhli]
MSQAVALQPQPASREALPPWNSHPPLENQVEPVADHSHPDQPDPHGLLQVETDGEEDKEGGSEVSSSRDEEEPVPEAHQVLLEVAGGLDPSAVQKVHGCRSGWDRLPPPGLLRTPPAFIPPGAPDL